MTKSIRITCAALMIGASFLAGTIFSASPLYGGMYSTCKEGRIDIHKAGFFGFKLDHHLKLMEVEQSSDHTLYITVGER